MLLNSAKQIATHILRMVSFYVVAMSRGLGGHVPRHGNITNLEFAYRFFTRLIGCL